MKIALLTNILNPYRKAFYHELNRQLIGKGDSFKVLVMSPSEYDRQWKYEDYTEEFTELLNAVVLDFEIFPYILILILKNA